MNLLITGANGQLGNEMRILAKGSQDKYIFTDVNEVEGQETIYLDITNRNAVREIVKAHSIEAIVNCAAYTNVDAAESSETLAEQLNALAPENLALAMHEVGGLLIHISTDYVFGSETYNTPCREDQKGTPTGIYGLTKKHGEERIAAVGCDHVIIRTAWLYSEFGKNFCKTMLNLTSTKPSLNVVFDQCGTPTYAFDLAQAIERIISDYKSSVHRPYVHNGIYHYSNEGVTSWYDFAIMIARFAGHHDCDITPCYSSQYPSPVRRPAYSVLDKTKIKQTFGINIPHWIDSLQQCIANLNNC